MSKKQVLESKRAELIAAREKMTPEERTALFRKRHDEVMKTRFAKKKK